MHDVNIVIILLIWYFQIQKSLWNRFTIQNFGDCVSVTHKKTGCYDHNLDADERISPSDVLESRLE